MIPQIQPWIDHEELEQLQRVISSTFVTENQLTAEFEARTRELTGAKHAITITNGTMALYVALKALGIKAGDEVIVPDLTFIATANAVIMAGGTPVFCDIRSDTFCIDVNKAESLISPRTKGIIPVHLYGQSADMQEIVSFSATYNLFILEDAAQGVGVRFNGKHVGTFGTLGVLSYYGNKTITCGEGGIVLTDDDRLAKEIYRLKNHGRDAKGTFIHDHIGYNFSFTEMQAAVGIAQMNKLNRIIERKRKIYERYVTELTGVPGFEPVYIDRRCDPVFWFTSFLVKDAEKVADFLREKEIQTRRFFYPLHLQPCYKDLDLNPINFKTTEDIFKRGLSLPSSYQLSESEQSFIIDSIKEFRQ